MTYATVKTNYLQSPLNKHIHYWTLALIAGRIVAICKCGETMEYRAVIEKLNRE